MLEVTGYFGYKGQCPVVFIPFEFLILGAKAEGMRVRGLNEAHVNEMMFTIETNGVFAGTNLMVRQLIRTVDQGRLKEIQDEHGKDTHLVCDDAKNLIWMHVAFDGNHRGEALGRMTASTDPKHAEYTKSFLVQCVVVDPDTPDDLCLGLATRINEVQCVNSQASYLDKMVFTSTRNDSMDKSNLDRVQHEMRAAPNRKTQGQLWSSYNMQKAKRISESMQENATAAYTGSDKPAFLKTLAKDYSANTIKGLLRMLFIWENHGLRVLETLVNIHWQDCITYLCEYSWTDRGLTRYCIFRFGMSLDKLQKANNITPTQ